MNMLAIGLGWLACGFAGFWLNRAFLLKPVLPGADELLIVITVLGGPPALVASLIFWADARRK